MWKRTKVLAAPEKMERRKQMRGAGPLKMQFSATIGSRFAHFRRPFRLSGPLLPLLPLLLISRLVRHCSPLSRSGRDACVSLEFFGRTFSSFACRFRALPDSCNIFDQKKAKNELSEKNKSAHEYQRAGAHTAAARNSH